MNIVVTGSLGYDYIMDFPGLFADRIMPDKIHQISLSFLVDKLSKQMGGTAGNIAYSLGLLGAKPLIVSTAGNDFAPYKAYLRKKKINTKYIKEYKTEGTSSYFVVTDRDDNQIGSFYVGAMKHAKKLSLVDVTRDPAMVVIAPTDPEAMKRYVKECRKHNWPYLYDPAFQIATFTPEDLREGIEGAQILIGNDYEIALIEEKLGIVHDELRVMVPVVVTTLGPKGSVIETRYDAVHAKPAIVKKVVDPTGAGDAYRAGFLVGFLKEMDVGICGQMGSVSAAYAVEHYGTQNHGYTKKEFVKRYRENFSDIIEL